MAVVGPVIARMRARAPREVAWNYLADGALRASWWPDAELDVVFGGTVAERWTAENGESASRNAVGAVDVLIEGHALGFRWRDGSDEHETAVLVTFRSQGDETDIMVTETGFGVFPDAFERTADAQQSWIDLLTDYVAVLREAAPVEAEVAGGIETEAAEVVEAAEAVEVEAAENDQADATEAVESEPADDVESDELSDLEEVFEADEAPDTDAPEPSNVDAQQADEEPEDEAPDFDSLIRGDVGDKA
ncbi:activator of Hsp90 ATPase-like protein [Leucobacter komagatae]|uniref:Activator of Hsp90 ATPase-like protein n=1 Tax=Leucobacter komagatae TaxID=55969 RepID=A0A542Y920_9MICO|nr:SRPBCC domain-containing protein [Leucobacter komagatae]TQL44576.1 activator of Hsp90 ATPase-like protein [Leucobacter komagatae]